MSCLCTVEQILEYFNKVKSHFEIIRNHIVNFCGAGATKLETPYDCNFQLGGYESAIYTVETTTITRTLCDNNSLISLDKNWDKITRNPIETGINQRQCKFNEKAHKFDKLVLILDSINKVNESIAEVESQFCIQAKTINRIRNAIIQLAPLVAKFGDIVSEPMYPENEWPDISLVPIVAPKGLWTGGIYPDCYEDYQCIDFDIKFTESITSTNYTGNCDSKSGDCWANDTQICNPLVEVSDFFNPKHIWELPFQSAKMVPHYFCWCCDCDTKKCKYTWKSTYECTSGGSGVWSVPELISTECVFDCVPSSGWEINIEAREATYIICGDECETSDDCPSPAFPPPTPTTDISYLCRSCKYIWKSTYNCNTSSWGDPELVESSCIDKNECSEVAWTIDPTSVGLSGGSQTGCLAWTTTCVEECVDGTTCSNKANDNKPAANPTIDPPLQCCCCNLIDFDLTWNTLSLSDSPIYVGDSQDECCNVDQLVYLQGISEPSTECLEALGGDGIYSYFFQINEGDGGEIGGSLISINETNQFIIVCHPPFTGEDSSYNYEVKVWVQDSSNTIICEKTKTFSGIITHAGSDTTSINIYGNPGNPCEFYAGIYTCNNDQVTYADEWEWQLNGETISTDYEAFIDLSNYDCVTTPGPLTLTVVANGAAAPGLCGLCEANFSLETTVDIPSECCRLPDQVMITFDSSQTISEDSFGPLPHETYTFSGSYILSKCNSMSFGEMYELDLGSGGYIMLLWIDSAWRIDAIVAGNEAPTDNFGCSLVISNDIEYAQWGGSLVANDPLGSYIYNGVKGGNTELNPTTPVGITVTLP